MASRFLTYFCFIVLLFSRNLYASHIEFFEFAQSQLCSRNLIDPQFKSKIGGQSLFNGHIGAVFFPRKVLQELLPRQLLLSDKKAGDHELYPLLFLVGMQTQTMSRGVFGIPLPGTRDYDEFIFLIPFVKVRGHDNVSSYNFAVTMYTDHRLAAILGNSFFGYSKQLVSFQKNIQKYNDGDATEIKLSMGKQDVLSVRIEYAEGLGATAHDRKNFKALMDTLNSPILGLRDDGRIMKSMTSLKSAYPNNQPNQIKFISHMALGRNQTRQIPWNSLSQGEGFAVTGLRWFLAFPPEPLNSDLY